MSRPQLRQKYTRRLLMEALEDRRVLTGLAIGATALVELAITVPAPAHVAELEQSAHVSVSTGAEAAELPSNSKFVHENIVELRHDYQGARHELVEDFQEARVELRELQQDLRTETGTPLGHELIHTVNDTRVELKQELHEQLVELREEFRDAHQNNGNDNGGTVVVGKEMIRQVVRDVDVSDKVEAVARLSESAEDAAQSLNQVNPDTPDALVSHSDRIVPPDADQARIPADAMANNQQAPATVGQEDAVVHSAATADESGSIPTATAPWAELPVGSVGVVAQEELAPVAVVIAGTDSEADAELQGAGLAAGDSSFSTASLDAALQQILQGADDFARTLTRNPGMVPWLLAALAGGIGLELYRRKKKAGRATLAAASLTANSTLSWVPGMPGSFSDEDA